MPARRSVVPSMVVLVCLPLTVVTAFSQSALLLRSLDERLFIAIGFVSALAYLVTFLPALLLAEPFAIGASIWYTQRRFGRDGESVGALLTCWAAVLVHTATIAFALRHGWR